MHVADDEQRIHARVLAGSGGGAISRQAPNCNRKTAGAGDTFHCLRAAGVRHDGPMKARSRLWRVLALSLLLVGWGARPARARATRATSLDSSPERAAVVALGTVLSERQVGRDVHQGTPVTLLDVSVRIEDLIKAPPGTPPAGPLVVRHRRVVPDSRPMINGFHFVELSPGHHHLFLLSRDGAGHLVLQADEDSNLVELSAEDLKAVAARPVETRTGPVAQVTAILEVLLARCTQNCRAPIWLLGHSPRYRRSLGTGPGRQAFIDQLLRVTRLARSGPDGNDLLAAYTVLGELDVRSILPALIDRLCAAVPARGYIPSNDVSWLQGFPPAVEMRALQEVARRAADPGVRELAAWRLGYLRSNR
jgi:hypothetical protein